MSRRWRTPPQLAEELGADPAKIIIEIRAGRLAAIDLATPGSKRPRYRISPEAIEAFLASRQVRPPVPKPPRRRRMATATKEYF
jgi:hypothetical protein